MMSWRCKRRFFGTIWRLSFKVLIARPSEPQMARTAVDRMSTPPTAPR
jgi:hypothetical protein